MTQNEGLVLFERVIHDVSFYDIRDPNGCLISLNPAYVSVTGFCYPGGDQMFVVRRYRRVISNIRPNGKSTNGKSMLFAESMFKMS